MTEGEFISDNNRNLPAHGITLVQVKNVQVQNRLSSIFLKPKELIILNFLACKKLHF